ncbi:hypothetical protein AAF712_007679 [Marasmius tenuissimus]|uniref:Uncharacterized protein n=1 Tax=Marasmius tenuissimus TaxID=585030 RepID=A0ABR2ZUR4_9AGAR|nr:hypothetical protein PM082_024698 [Marasmius tenuissimus]
MFRALSITVLAFLLPSVLTISPPSSINIVHPSSSRTSGIGNGTLLPFGISDTFNDDNNIYWGLWRLVNISVTLPNGTISPVLGVGTLDLEKSDKQCRIFPGSKYVGRLRADQNGSYTAHWAVTYGITPDSSQIVSGESCGPGPLSHQNFTIEHRFDVVLNGNDESKEVPEETATRELGAQPTGSVVANPTRGGQPTEGPSGPGSGSGGNGGASTYGTTGVTTIMLSALVGVLITML